MILTKFGVKTNFTKIRSVGAALIHADRRTDTKKPIGAFRDYANAPKIEVYAAYIQCIINSLEGKIVILLRKSSRKIRISQHSLTLS